MLRRRASDAKASRHAATSSRWRDWHPSLLKGDGIPIGIEVMDVGSHDMEVPRGELREIDGRRIDRNAGAPRNLGRTDRSVPEEWAGA